MTKTQLRILYTLTFGSDNTRRVAKYLGVGVPSNERAAWPLAFVIRNDQIIEVGFVQRVCNPSEETSQ